MMGWGWDYKPYVSVGQRREQARRKMDKLRKQGINVQAVEIDGRKIARTFWGQSWCQHLESFSDYENRLPRGRTYVRNGSVCHLEIASGEVKAMVSGSELYDVKIAIKQLPAKKWGAVKERCSGKIGSLLELLQGRLSSSVMTVVTDRNQGLFPLPSEISLDCSCPDWAVMCKHVAAVLYGVGARLDERPELLFLLRGVDHEELIAVDAAASVTGSKQSARRIAQSDLEDVFGIELLVEESSSNGQSMAKPGKEASGVRVSRHAGNSKKNGADTDAQPVKKTKAVSQTATRALKTTFGDPKDTELKGTRSKDAELKNTRSKGAGLKAANSKDTGLKGTQPKGTKSNVSKSKESTSREPSLPAAINRSFTGKTVRELRARLEMSQSEFAQLIDVSAASVSTWEQKRGRLNLQPRTLNALTAADKLTKKQAWTRLGI